MKTVTAIIRHIDNKSQVTFKVNDVVINDFSFSGTSFVANNVSLNPDSNVLFIQAVNAGGTGTAATVVIRTSGVNINNSGNSNNSGVGIQNQTGGGTSNETGGNGAGGNGTGGNGKKTTGTQNDPKGGTKSTQGGSRGGSRSTPAPDKGRSPK